MKSMEEIPGLSHTTDGQAGTWRHDDIPLMNQDGGHGMVFEGLRGEKLLAIHELVFIKIALKSFGCRIIMIGR